MINIICFILMVIGITLLFKALWEFGHPEKVVERIRSLNKEDELKYMSFHIRKNSLLSIAGVIFMAIPYILKIIFKQ